MAEELKRLDNSGFTDSNNNDINRFDPRDVNSIGDDQYLRATRTQDFTSNIASNN